MAASPWLVAATAFYSQKYMQIEYLTMWEASKVCSYSQEYLSLLSRKRLLKAIKKENKWLTTVPWLTEYLVDKKPDEALALEKKVSQVLEAKRSGIHKGYLAVAIAVTLILMVAAIVFSQMSSKISTLEATNRAMSQARADALAGFDPSVLDVLEETAPSESGNMSPQ